MEKPVPEWAQNGLIDDSASMGNQTFDTFLADANNAEALEAVHAVLRGDEKRIIIWGENGCGKTHLLKAAYSQVRQTAPGAEIRYLHASDFVDGMIQSIRASGHTRGWSDLLSGLDYLLIDDIRCMERKPGTQRAFLDCLERAGDACGIVMTSDRPPDACWEQERAIRRKLERYRPVQIRGHHPELLRRRAALIRQLRAHMQIEMPEGAAGTAPERETAAAGGRKKDRSKWISWNAARSHFRQIAHGKGG